MIWPRSSVRVNFRSPFTATSDVIPSLPAFPPNMLAIRPSAPPNCTRDFSCERTSAVSDAPAIAASAMTAIPVLSVVRIRANPPESCIGEKTRRVYAPPDAEPRGSPDHTDQIVTELHGGTRTDTIQLRE